MTNEDLEWMDGGDPQMHVLGVYECLLLFFGLVSTGWVLVENQDLAVEKVIVGCCWGFNIFSNIGIMDSMDEWIYSTLECWFCTIFFLQLLWTV